MFIINQSDCDSLNTLEHDIYSGYINHYIFLIIVLLR